VIRQSEWANVHGLCEKREWTKKTTAPSRWGQPAFYLPKISAIEIHLLQRSE
jgi:hypothetical protein